MMLSLLKWINLALVLVSMVILLAPYVNPVYFWPLSITGLFFPWMLLLHVIFLSFWLYHKNRYFLFSLGWIVISWNNLSSLVGFSIPDATDESLSVLSLNCHGFISPLTGKPPDAEAWKAFIANIEEVDFLFFQEFPPNGKYPGNGSAVAKKLFARHWPHQYINRGRLAILSKHPLSDKTVKYFANGVNRYMMAKAEVKGQKINLLNVHLRSNRITSMADELAANPDINEKETLGNMVEMLRRYKNASIERAEQAGKIASLLEKQQGSLVLAGDFNDTPLSHAYHRINTWLIDGFREKGMGIGTTYQGKLPGLRIDYIFFSPDLFVSAYRHRKTNYSDHKIVQANFRLKE